MVLLSIGGSVVESLELLLFGLSGVSGSNKFSFVSIFLVGEGFLGKRLRCLRIGMISLSVRGVLVFLFMNLN